MESPRAKEQRGLAYLPMPSIPGALGQEKHRHMTRKMQGFFSFSFFF